MSDLISRSELLKELKSLKIVLNGKQIFSDDAKDTVLRIVNEQPTAYDIDKVIEELEKSKRKLFSFANDYSEVGDFAMAEIYSQRASEYITAIAIVNQGGDTSNMVSYKNSVWNGGASDDVCEWKTEHIVVGMRRHMPNCCDKGLDMPVSTASGLKYCPYCGKKIKVVE